jgi:hypothetical protein
MKQLLILFLLLTSGIFAQKKEKITVIYDVIYMKDGRILKGEIINFQEKDGDITSKDAYDRKYSITREEYKYFMEDVSFKMNKKRDTLIVHPRKDFEMEYSFGVSSTMSRFNHQFSPDAYYLSSNWAGTYSYIPLCLKIGIGKYFGRENYLGINSDIAIATNAQSFYTISLKYQRQYDAFKNNVALYVPIELQYNFTKFDVAYQVDDTLVDVQSGGIVTYYPSQISTNQSVQSLGFSVGQGFSFIRQNKRSISLELSLFKNFVLNHQFYDLNRENPKSEFKNSGLKLSFFYSI